MKYIMRVSQALTNVDFGLILAKNTERTPRSFLFHFKKLKQRTSRLWGQEKIINKNSITTRKSNLIRHSLEHWLSSSEINSKNPLLPLCGKTSNFPFIVINSYETEIIFEGALKKGEKEERKINEYLDLMKIKNSSLKEKTVQVDIMNRGTPISMCTEKKKLKKKAF